MADDQDQGLQPVSLRETLESAIHEHGESSSEEIARARDEQGRFAKQEQATQEEQSPLPAAAPAEPPSIERPPRPSSWKKEFEDHWSKLDPALANYLNERERQYATGVSTYKREAAAAQEIQQALQPFMADLQRANMAPSQWINSLGTAHQTLVYGSPQQKLQMFAQLANDYGVDLKALGVEGQVQIPDAQNRWVQEQISQLSGKVNQFENLFTQQEQQTLLSEIQRFAADKDNHPHFEQVRETMAGLLQSGLAQDLESAYRQATRLNDDIWQTQQAEQVKRQQAEQAEQAARARAKTVSLKSAAPSGAVQSGATGRRDAIREALAAHSSGRV